MTQDEYEIQEMHTFNLECQVKDRLPLEERKQNGMIFLDDLQNNQERFAMFVDLLVNGSYGAGAFFAYKYALNNRKTNIFAWVLQAIGYVEYNVERVRTNRIYYTLSMNERDEINEIISQAIDYSEEE